jgi:hypothetical protein
VASFSVVDVLQTGLSGLIFLLAFLAYRILSKALEQKGGVEAAVALKAARSYLWPCVVLVILAGSFPLVEQWIGRGDRARVLGECRDSLERLDTFSRMPGVTAEDFGAQIRAHVATCGEGLAETASH